MDFLSALARLQPVLNDLALLLARLVFGGFMLVGHGWSKAQLIGTDKAANFPDPLGIGNQASLLGAVAGEVLCCVLICLGLLTRFACLGLVFTMAVAAFVIHAADPLFMGGGASKEPALLYLTAGLILLLTGPGRISIDQLIKATLLRSEPSAPPTGR